MDLWPKVEGAGGVPGRVPRPKLTVAQMQDLRTVYARIMMDGALLTEIAARKGLTIRGLYERLVWDVAQLDADIARLSESQEGVNKAT